MEKKSLRQRADEASIRGFILGGMGFGVAITLIFMGAMYANVPGIPLPGDTVVKEEVPAFGEAGYVATEEFCRDALTEVHPAIIPERLGFELMREKDGVQESMLVVIDPITNNVLYSTYDNNTIEPMNAVITNGARKCFQEKVLAR